MLDVANTGSYVGLRSKIGLPVHHRQFGAGSLVECPQIINRLENMCSCISGFALKNYEYNF